MRIRRIIECPVHMVAVAFIAVILSGVVCGCQAPQGIQSAQRSKGRALAMYLRNDARIDGVLSGLWKKGRDREVAATASSVAHAAVTKFGVVRASFDKDGKKIGPEETTLTGPQAVELAGAIVAEVGKANAVTDAILSKLKIARDVNAKTLLQYAELEQAIIDYQMAGIDEAMLDEFSKYLVTAIQTIQTGKDK